MLEHSQDVVYLHESCVCPKRSLLCYQILMAKSFKSFIHG